METDERLKILIIEDEPILAMELSDTLEDEGYDVVSTVNNGRKALDIFKRQPVDLVLCDITIKGDWDGIQTVQQLLTERSVPVIYLTALTDRDTLNRAKQTYPAAYVNKPYQLHNLRAAIELAVSNFAARTNPIPAVAVTPAAEREIPGKEAILRINNQVFIKQNYQFVKVNLADVQYLEADNIYTTLLAGGKKYAIRLTLTNVLERINWPDLVRIHRSFAVNINNVDSFNENEVSVGPQLIPLSRNFKDEFMRHFIQR